MLVNLHLVMNNCFICFEECEKDISDSDLLISCGYHDAHILCVDYWLNRNKGFNTRPCIPRCCVCRRKYKDNELQKLERISELLTKNILKNFKSRNFNIPPSSLSSGFPLPLNVFDWDECARVIIKTSRKDWILIIKNVPRCRISFFWKYHFLRVQNQLSRENFAFWVSNGEICEKYMSDESLYTSLVEFCIINAFWDDAALVYVVAFKKFTRTDKIFFGRLLLEFHILNNAKSFSDFNFNDSAPESFSCGNGRYSVVCLLMYHNHRWTNFIIKKIIIPIIVKLELEPDLQIFSKKIFENVHTFRYALIETLRSSKIAMLKNLLLKNPSRRINLMYCLKMRHLLDIQENSEETFKLIAESYSFSEDPLFRLMFRKYFKVINSL